MEFYSCSFLLTNHGGYPTCLTAYADSSNSMLETTSVGDPVRAPQLPDAVFFGEDALAVLHDCHGSVIFPLRAIVPPNRRGRLQP